VTHNRTLARRYAVAVGDLAKEQNILDTIESELVYLQDLLTQSTEFRQLLTDEKFTKETQATTLRSLFAGKLHPITLNFLLLLVNKHRAGYLSEIVIELKHYADQVRNILAVQVTTAVPLDADQVDTLESSVQHMSDIPCDLTKPLTPR
jgi:F-type H+-transporting ATPase subunit delta